jgi:hypothetical protein
MGTSAATTHAGDTLKGGIAPNCNVYKGGHCAPPSRDAGERTITLRHASRSAALSVAKSAIN